MIPNTIQNTGQNNRKRRIFLNKFMFFSHIVTQLNVITIIVAIIIESLTVYC